MKILTQAIQNNVIFLIVVLSFALENFINLRIVYIQFFFFNVSLRKPENLEQKTI